MDLVRERKGELQGESFGAGWVEMRAARRGSDERRWLRAASISGFADRDLGILMRGG